MAGRPDGVDAPILYEHEFVRPGGRRVDVSKLILAGASPRGIMSLTRAARVVAWFAGRDYLTPDDVRTVAPSWLGYCVFFTRVYELRRAQIADALVAANSGQGSDAALMDTAPEFHYRLPGRVGDNALGRTAAPVSARARSSWLT